VSAIEQTDAYAQPRSRTWSALRPLRATASVYKWELLKLRAQKRTYLGLGAAALVPVAFVVALVFHSGGGPRDIPLGRYLRESGLATPFVVLEFMSIWGLPLISALVAGDIVASESHNGTLKTILTRSRERGEVFAGKVLAAFTYTLAAMVVMAAVGLAAATAEWGFKPLTSLSGPRVSAPHSLVLLLGTLGVYLLALLGIAAFGLLISTVTRNSAAAVVSTLMFALLMQLVGALPGTEPVRPYLLSNQFTAWHGFLRVPVDWAPIGHALWISAIYVTVPLVAAYLVFLRRDVAGD
jgi:ABC-2 type transport system permease protein